MRGAASSTAATARGLARTEMEHGLTVAVQQAVDDASKHVRRDGLWQRAAMVLHQGHDVIIAQLKHLAQHRAARDVQTERWQNVG